MPLLHPAAVLSLGEVRAAAGFSANLAAGGLADAARGAANEAAANAQSPGAPGTDVTYARGALVAAAIGPGLAPFVSARVGIGHHVEGGLSYTGRAVRADLRRSFRLTPHWALSAGAGGSAALYGRQDGTTLRDVDLQHLHGWGADVPVLFGYESDGDLYHVWFGPRGGWEHVDISHLESVPLGAAPISLSASRASAGACLGLAVGFRHVHIAMELDASYVSVTGDYNQTHAEVAGLALAPASALWWTF